MGMWDKEEKGEKWGQIGKGDIHDEIQVQCSCFAIMHIG
jgi:hypothetical protein